MNNISFMPAAEIGRHLQAGDLTSTSVTQHFLQRIDSLNPKLNAFIDVFHDEALALAKASDLRRQAGLSFGPLDGVPIALKDLCGIQGRPLSVGSRMLLSEPAAVTAESVRRLLAAGAVIIGKTQMVEFAFGGWGTNPLLGTPWNPWEMTTHRVPGGSSSGSGVAVAAGMVPAAIGSDTGGSVRIPATLNGITGLKTTAGLISLHGCANLSTTLDSLGPMARTALDTSLITTVLMGYDPKDPRTRAAPLQSESLPTTGPFGDLRGMVIGVLAAESFPLAVDDAVLKALQQARDVFNALGATTIDRTFPLDFYELTLLNGKITAAEAYAEHSAYIHDDNQPIGPWVRKRVVSGGSISAADYLHALQARQRLQHEWQQWMQGFDALLLPGLPVSACPVEAVDETSIALATFTRPCNFLGGCALALPAGFDDSGLPVGIQLQSTAFQEHRLLNMGLSYQGVTRWHEYTPSLEG